MPVHPAWSVLSENGPAKSRVWKIFTEDDRVKRRWSSQWTGVYRQVSGKSIPNKRVEAVLAELAVESSLSVFFTPPLEPAASGFLKLLKKHSNYESAQELLNLICSSGLGRGVPCARLVLPCSQGLSCSESRRQLLRSRSICRRSRPTATSTPPRRRVSAPRPRTGSSPRSTI